MTKKKAIESLKTTFISALIIATISLPSFYIYLLNSEPYKNAVILIKQSEKIKETIGEIKEVNVSPFTSLWPHFDENNGSANLTLLVKTNKTKANLKVFTIKTNGIWYLERYKIKL